MTPLPTRDELVQALAAVDGNQRSRPLILDRLYGPLADGVLELLRQVPPQVFGEDGERVARVARDEAEKRWPQDPSARQQRSAKEWLDEGMASGFVLGAQWHAALCARPSEQR